MTDPAMLSDEELAPGVILRRAPGADVVARPGAAGRPAVVRVAHGAVWVCADAGSPGVDLSHGTVNVVVRAGTVLFDAHSGSGLVIVVRGRADLSAADSDRERRAHGGEAVTFDSNGEISPPDPIDADELAHDAFVGQNLVLDALAGDGFRLPEDPTAAKSGGEGPRLASDEPPTRSRSLFGRRR